jgi:hypothetical protein
MTLSDLASIGSLVSGIAVLVSLLYLSLQVRQTERNQRAMMNQGVVNRSCDTIRWLSDPHMSQLGSRVDAGETHFTAQELYQLRLRVRASLISAQDTYVQHQAGLADQITFDNNLAIIKGALAQPVYRAIWKSTRTSFAPDWMAYVDQMIEATPVAKPTDTVAHFNADLAEVMN